MNFKDCNWCGYIYPVTPGQRTCPYCGCKITDQPPKRIELGKDRSQGAREHQCMYPQDQNKHPPLVMI